MTAAPNSLISGMGGKLSSRRASKALALSPTRSPSKLGCCQATEIESVLK
jgi:hypothetical protein